MKIIGTSKVAIQNKITIIENVAKYLDIEPGDQVAFIKSNSGDIILKKLSNVEVIKLEDK